MLWNLTYSLTLLVPLSSFAVKETIAKISLFCFYVINLFWSNKKVLARNGLCEQLCIIFNPHKNFPSPCFIFLTYIEIIHVYAKLLVCLTPKKCSQSFLKTCSPASLSFVISCENGQILEHEKKRVHIWNILLFGNKSNKSKISLRSFCNPRFFFPRSWRDP